MAWRRHVGVDATMGTVCTTAQARSTVHLDATRIDDLVSVLRATDTPSGRRICDTHLDVIDDKTVDIEAFVFGVRLSVLQQLQHEIGGFLRPTSLRGLPLFGLSATTDASVEATEGNALLLLNDVLQEALGTTKRHVLDGLCGLVRVLEPKGKLFSSHWPPHNLTEGSTYFEVHSQMRSAGLAGFRRVFCLTRVFTHVS